MTCMLLESMCWNFPELLGSCHALKFLVMLLRLKRMIWGQILHIKGCEKGKGRREEDSGFCTCNWSSSPYAEAFQMVLSAGFLLESILPGSDRGIWRSFLPCIVNLKCGQDVTAATNTCPMYSPPFATRGFVFIHILMSAGSGSISQHTVAWYYMNDVKEGILKHQATRLPVSAYIWKTWDLPYARLTSMSSRFKPNMSLFLPQGLMSKWCYDT